MSWGMSRPLDFPDPKNPARMPASPSAASAIVTKSLIEAIGGNEMRRLSFIFAFTMLMIGFTTSAQAATTLTVDFGNAPQGTHFVTGTPTPSCTVTALVVNCNSYQLAGVGNTNATADLTVTYSATVQCRNHGGQIVEVHSQTTTVSSSTGQLEPKNGRLLVPALSSAPAPTAEEFEALATCPNPNWTAEILAGSITLTSFTYTVTFAGFTEPAIMITGP
jgi:hypothetical protein